MIFVEMNKKFSVWKVFLFILLIFIFYSCNEMPTENSYKGLHVPDGFSITPAVPPGLVSSVYFATFDDEGRLFVFESDGRTTSTEEMKKNPSFRIRRLEDRDGDGIFEQAVTYADKIPFPMGGDFHQGSLFVAAPPNLIKFTDADGDGLADKRETILTGWVFYHNAAILSGPFIGPDGWLYLCDARRGFEIKTKEGELLKGKSARIWRCRTDGTGLESVSGGGFDNTIELVFMPSGEAIGTMTYFMDPQAGQRDALIHWVEGGVYPKPHPVIESDKLKLTGELMPVMSKFARVSPSGLMRYQGNSFGTEFTGNLFSAQFNTGRIMRHIVSSDGATFRTQDEPFMTSSAADIHPTDVLQDGDGSLLIIDTGGWFIAGCPLSRVAKLNVPGGLYRIRKIGVPKVEDPWGKQLNFKGKDTKLLASFLKDSRPVVRAKAIEQLVKVGAPSIDDLKKILIDSDQEDTRSSAVFALYRINTPGSIKVIHNALNDKSSLVRTAACRVLGLAKDKEAVEKLMELVQMDQAPVRRQAATALGQIGDKKAVSALLKASSNPDDRFVEHAIIYALNILGDTEKLIEALKNTSGNIRRASLIALDQMEGSPLRKEHLAPFLSSEDSLQRYTGIWVAKRHPEWADLVMEFLKPLFSSKKKIDGMKSTLRDLMAPFCSNPGMQNFIASQLGNVAVPNDRKLLMMETIGQSNVGKLPDAWVQQIGRLLEDKDSEISACALDLIELRTITTFDQQLIRISENPITPVHLRLKALGARIKSRPKLAEKEFQLLLGYLEKNNEPPVRQLAAQLLAQAEPDKNQLLVLARGQVKEAESFLLPGLIKIFQGGHDEEVGRTLLKSLQVSIERLDNLSVEEIKNLLEAYPPSVKELGGPLMKTMEIRESNRLLRLQKLEATLSGGDVGEGRNLFFGKGTCFTCHSIGDKGGDFGPDLTNIGEIRSRHDILEAILYPAASFAREYETFRVVTKNGEYSGTVTDPQPEYVTVRTGPGVNIRILRIDIKSIVPETVSMMPSGLNKLLTPKEMADLMSFLETLPDGLGH